MPKRSFQDITNCTSKKVKVTVHRSTHRRTLFRWIFEVCRDFRYSNYTHATAVQIVDLYTRKHGLNLSMYQLLGTSALFLAAKIEEKQTRKVLEYSMVTESSCSVRDILSMERKLIDAIDTGIIEIPHVYCHLDFFKNNFPTLSMEMKTELFNCILATALERTTRSDNMFFLYLEAIKEMETLLKSRTPADDIEFYLGNSPTGRAILKNVLNK